LKLIPKKSLKNIVLNQTATYFWLMEETQENKTTNFIKLKLKSLSIKCLKISQLLTQLVTAKFLLFCKSNKNNYRLWFTWTQNSKNGQE